MCGDKTHDREVLSDGILFVLIVSFASEDGVFFCVAVLVTR